MSNFIYISEEQVRELLDLKNVHVAVKEALVCSVSSERSIQSARTFTKMLGNDCRILTMPGCLKSEQLGTVAGCKFVGMCPGNALRQPPLPTITANIALFDGETGALQAVIAGTEITSVRTAVASVVATQHLTESNNVKVLTILGAGVQGKSHALAFQNFYSSLGEVRIWNHNYLKAESLASELNGSSTRKVCKSFRCNEECVKGADVIVTATNASSPIVRKEWLKEGAHINVVGYGWAELSEEIYQSSDVYIDHIEGAKSELAGLGQIGVQFKGAIGEVVKGTIQPSSDPERITVFQSLGMVVEDCAVAKMIYNLHRKNNKTEQSTS